MSPLSPLHPCKKLPHHHPSISVSTLTPTPYTHQCHLVSPPCSSPSSPSSPSPPPSLPTPSSSTPWSSSRENHPTAWEQYSIDWAREMRLRCIEADLARLTLAYP